MSMHVTDFKWEKGKNDLQYIELLEKTLKNEQVITAKAVAKIRELSAKNKEIRNEAIDEFAERLKKYTYGRCNGLHIEVPLNIFDEITEEMRGAE